MTRLPGVKLLVYVASVACFAVWFYVGEEGSGALFVAATILGVCGIVWSVASAPLRLTVPLWLGYCGVVWLVGTTMAEYPDMDPGSCDPGCFPSFGMLDFPMFVSIFAIPLTAVAIAVRAVEIGVRSVIDRRRATADARTDEDVPPV